MSNSVGKQKKNIFPLHQGLWHRLGTTLSCFNTTMPHAQSKDISDSLSPCAHSGDCHPKTETDTLPLSSHSRRRRQLKVEYEEDEGVTPVKTEHWEPPDWKKQLGYIREMRSGRDAPVDNMGAEKCYDSEAPAHVRVFRFFKVNSV